MSALASHPEVYTNVAWAPQPGSQVMFLTCPFREVLLHSGRWCGKSDALLADFLRGVGQGYGPAWRGIFFRRNYDDLTDPINKAQSLFPKAYGKGCAFTRSPHPVYRWSTGEELLFRAIEDVDQYSSYHGGSYQWLGFDELAEWPTRDVYLKLQSILKSANPEIAKLCRVRSACNPSGPGRGWVMERFSPTTGHVITDSKDADGNTDPPRVAIQFYLHENRILLDAEPEAFQKIAAACSSPAEVAAWVYGRWDVLPEGIIGDVYDARVHEIDDFDVPSSWYLDRSLDWGSSSPWACTWYGESNGEDVMLRNGRWRSTVPGDLFIIGEAYGWSGRANIGSKMVVADVAKAVIQQEQALGLYGRVAPGPGDVWNTSSITTSNTMADEFLKPVWLDSGQMVAGLQWTRPDKSAGSIKQGWEIMRRMLRDAKPQPNKPRENPGLYIFRSAHHWIRTVPTLPRDSKKPDHEAPKSENHLAETTRARLLAHGRRPFYSRVRGMC